ncbi:TonB-dependent receptor [Flavobacterium sp. B11]|uniref:TonB-dependent receptor domain-containing protein n=1 Tax=Flavobacterium movens TaxID=214860 RepID=UPI0031E1CAB3
MRVYLLIMLLFSGISFAQNTITGSVTDSNKQSVPGANVVVVGENTGASTDFDGSFKLTTTAKLPFSVKVSAVGFESKTVSVTAANQKINVILKGEETKLDEIVVSASRTPERVLESPVTIERMGVQEIKRTASPSFYDGLENMKEVQMNTSSMSFKSINTRGFATVANTRFMQLVDGMDNASPLLNFVLGNMIGVSEIDVQSVELLPGASSALYGANAFNGILFMTSKSPFTNQGISTYFKYGATSQEAAGTNSFYDFGIRFAHAFNKYFAAKANFTYMQATDWYATNYDDKTRSGIDRANPSYDGINVYGDEAATNIKGVGQKLEAMGLIPVGASNLLPNSMVSRTGYNEIDLTDNKAANTKIDFSLHGRPFGDERLEIIWQSKFGTGNAVYQGANRYYLNNFFMQQHKLEFKGKNFFVRGYMTGEDGGQSYDMIFTGININRKWKDDNTWFGQYAGAFIQGTLAGMTPEQAHAAARSTADTGRFLPGTPEFKNAFSQVISDPDVLTGSRLVDNSKMYHSDANYNFRDIIKFAEIQVGGSFRAYELNSHGRIYTDADSQINYNEYGAYAQLMKKFLDDRLKFTGSLRYDKSKNFDGNYSPRLSLVYSAGEKRNHNFRGSFQTGFRNPTTQDQYIGFNIGNAVLLGSAPDNLTRFNETFNLSAEGQSYTGSPTKVMNGNDAYGNSYIASSVTAFSAMAGSDPVAAAALLKKSRANYVKPEQVKAFELGYRSVFEGTSIDINGYYNIYNDFIGNLNVVSPFYGTAQDNPNIAAGTSDPGVQSIRALQNGEYRTYQLYTNSDVEINSLGFGVGLSRKIISDFELGVNYNYAQFDFDQAKDPSFEPGFNTPKHRVKMSIGNDKLFKNFGFNVSGRWNSEYLWQAGFADGIIKSATVIDAQVNYGIPKLKSVVKLGAANIGGKEYYQVIGAGLIGQQYFASWTINP